LHIALDHTTDTLPDAFSEDHIPKPVTKNVQVPVRSAVVIMEQQLTILS